MRETLESQIIDIASRQQAEQAQAQPTAADLPTARCNLISRQVQQHGAKWSCPACSRELAIWSDQVAGAVARNEMPRVNCPHCQTVHRLGKQLIFAPADVRRVAVPKMKLHAGR